MTSPISHAATDRAASMKRYRQIRSLRFLASLLVGLAIAYAENREWLPPICSSLVTVERIAPQSVIGPCILQTLVVPSLFALGLWSTAYFYTSRVYLLIFWILHGVDLLPALLYSPIALIPMAVVLAAMLALLSRCDTIAAAGVRTKGTPSGLALHRYLGAMLHLWGGLLICQFLFYTIQTLML